MNQRRLSVRCLGAVAFLALTLHCAADSIQVGSGPEVKGTVLRYKNHAFEVRMADGKTASYPSSNVKRIQFDAQPTPAKLTTRTSGMQEGVVSAFENGTFSITQAGATKMFSAIFVEQAEFVTDRGQSVEVITHGQQTEVTKHLALGNITIVDYYADWCGPCKQVSPALEQMAKSDPEVALRKVDIVDFESAVAKQYHINSIPRVEVYGRTGKLIGTVSGASAEQVKQYVAQAKRG